MNKLEYMLKVSSISKRLRVILVFLFCVKVVLAQNITYDMNNLSTGVDFVYDNEDTDPFGTEINPIEEIEGFFRSSVGTDPGTDPSEPPLPIADGRWILTGLAMLYGISIKIKKYTCTH